MFFKLCKMEFKQSWRPFILLYGLLLISAVMIGINGTEMNTFNGIMLLVYLACIMTVMILVIVNIIRNYYQSMFGKSSYLTHTLPVSSHQLLLSKILAGMLWGVISLLVIFITVLLLGLVVSRFLPSLSDWGALFKTLPIFQLETIFYLINVLLEYTQSILLIFLAITFVHTSYVHKYRAPIGILVYLIINFIVTFALSKFIVMPNSEGFFLFIFLADTNAALNTGDLGNIFLGLAINLILCCLYFFATKYFLDHKLEVE